MMFFKKASVARLSPTASNNDKELYVELSEMGNINIDIQPASSEVVAINEGIAGKTYSAFVSVSGIVVGDRVTVSGTGQAFVVKGRSDWNYGPIPHLELVLFESDN